MLFNRDEVEVSNFAWYRLRLRSQTTLTALRLTVNLFFFISLLTYILFIAS